MDTYELDSQKIEAAEKALREHPTLSRYYQVAASLPKHSVLLVSDAEFGDICRAYGSIIIPLGLLQFNGAQAFVFDDLVIRPQSDWDELMKKAHPDKYPEASEA